MKVFGGEFADMEAAFLSRFHSKVAQWEEIDAQLGSMSDEP